MYEIQQVLEHGQLYTDSSRPPFLLVQKTPFYPWLVASLIEVANWNYRQDAILLYRMSRVVSLLFSLLSAYLLVRIAKDNLGIRSGIAWITGMVGLIGLNQHFHSRTDALYLFVFLLIVYVLSRKKMPRGMSVTLAFLTVLAIGVKQSGVLYIPLIIMVLYDQYPANRKRLIRNYLVAGLSAGAAIFCLLQMWPVNWAILYQNLVGGLAVGRNLEGLWTVLSSESFGPLYVLSGIGLYLLVQIGTRKAQLLVLLLGYCTLLSCFLLLNVGAGVNYLVEFRFMLLLAWSYLAFRSDGTARSSRLVFGFHFILLLMLVARTNEIRVEYRVGEYQNNLPDYQEQVQVARYLQHRLARGEWVYYLNGESFYNNLLFDHLLFPAKLAIRDIYAYHPSTIDFSYFLNNMNDGLVKYLIRKRGVDSLVDGCFGKSFTRFQWKTTIGAYEIWVYVD